MMLTQPQLRFFHTFGYLSCQQLFDADETATITDEFEQTIQSVGGGNAHDGSRRTMFGGPIEHRPALCALLDDARILGLVGVYWERTSTMHRATATTMRGTRVGTPTATGVNCLPAKSRSIWPP